METGLGCSGQGDSSVKHLQCASNMGRPSRNRKTKPGALLSDTLRFITRRELVFRGEIPKSSPARTERQPGRRHDVGTVSSRLSRQSQEDHSKFEASLL